MVTTTKTRPVPPASIDSANFRQTFFGILNGYGAFWTPLVFEYEASAREHIVRFWNHEPQTRDRCLKEFQIVPVRVQLTHIPGKTA